MAASVYKWLSLSFFAFVHPFYVSVTEINHNEKDKTLEIACKLFLDDTEKTLNKQLKTPVELTKPKDPKQAQAMVSEYIKKHLQLKVDGKNIVIDFVGYEIEGASIWCYFQANNVAAVNKLSVMDNILYETYENQISIIHTTVKGEKKSTRIANPEKDASFEF
ncbi:MAG: hypothetical protein H7Y27_08795 [Gemmatimonadaceae bacterium]|nr:hypothetical protein [Chitinophagaceae bacterium]